MKFINYLKTIQDVSIYPMVSLILFSVFFLAAAYLAFRTDKQTMDAISHYPIDNDAPEK
ncbi:MULTISPECIES: CcoQ/FixQ family Cbb3-type cytochrome c oxidase assembly chaperone [Chitinophaga]|uniref:CcoQ/FixQ family Cbb3-type cytochrome c oxidase assembly chaperone n=1 Tax=Chitinophaga caseinilytica TaxID=2267521 RepID=A0ABZ2Z8U1_9BACT|nr:CcoQ/FixQ family Cbb3-type cytochrome c oxidase assembly chaperone [Chitinophaga rhizosphaerae]